jgi:mRNA interferase RelE/StbE
VTDEYSHIGPASPILSAVCLIKHAKADATKILDPIERELSKKAEDYPVFRGAFTGLRKLRIGEYRVIYAVREKEALILRIGNRREVYRFGI